jgi:DNA invertase Pin-like site-specific DNA recombinase
MATRTLTREAMAHKKSKGERVGEIPFGYDLAADGVTLVENADQLRAIELIHSLKEKGYSLRAIAEALDTAGVTTKKGAKTWNHKSVSNILSRSKAAAEHTTVYTLSERVDKTSKR